MLKIFKRKSIKLSKYKYKIIYKNHNITEGILEVENMDMVQKVFMLDKFCIFLDGRKAHYYNKNEIQELSVEKVEE